MTAALGGGDVDPAARVDWVSGPHEACFCGELEEHVELRDRSPGVVDDLDAQSRATRNHDARTAFTPLDGRRHEGLRPSLRIVQQDPRRPRHRLPGNQIERAIPVAGVPGAPVLRIETDL